LCVLPGWEHSAGARAEIALAAALDLLVGYLYDFHADSLIPAAALLHPVAHPSGETPRSGTCSRRCPVRTLTRRPVRST